MLVQILVLVPTRSTGGRSAALRRLGPALLAGLWAFAPGFTQSAAGHIALLLTTGSLTTGSHGPAPLAAARPVAPSVVDAVRQRRIQAAFAPVEPRPKTVRDAQAAAVAPAGHRQGEENPFAAGFGFVLAASLLGAGVALRRRANPAPA